MTNVAACFSKTCKEISITLGISSINKTNSFKIYPNPNEGNFTIEIDYPAKDISIEVYDPLGKLILNIETKPFRELYFIGLDIPPLGLSGPGIYFVKVKNGGMIYYQKLNIAKR